MYVYIRSEPNLYTVGFYSPDGKWNPDSDFGTRDEARQRVNYLNGGNDLAKLKTELDNFKSLVNLNLHNHGHTNSNKGNKLRMVKNVSVKNSRQP